MVLELSALVLLRVQETMLKSDHGLLFSNTFVIVKQQIVIYKMSHGYTINF
jgi:hypothetical protein